MTPTDQELRDLCNLVIDRYMFRDAENQVARALLSKLNAVNAAYELAAHTCELAHAVGLKASVHSLSSTSYFLAKAIRALKDQPPEEPRS